MPNNIIMADAKGGAEYETVSMPNAVTNGANLKTTIDSMNLPPLCLLITTKKKTALTHAEFMIGMTDQSGTLYIAYRWDGTRYTDRELTEVYDFKANEGDEFYIIPCPQT